MCRLLVAYSSADDQAAAAVNQPAFLRSSGRAAAAAAAHRRLSMYIRWVTAIRTPARVCIESRSKFVLTTRSQCCCVQ
jgi:hypothetical protein